MPKAIGPEPEEKKEESSEDNTLEEAQGPLDTSIKDDATASRVWKKISDLVMELEALKEEGKQ